MDSFFLIDTLSANVTGVHCVFSIHKGFVSHFYGGWRRIYAEYFVPARSPFILYRHHFFKAKHDDLAQIRLNTISRGSSAYTIFTYSRGVTRLDNIFALFT